MTRFSGFSSFDRDVRQAVPRGVEQGTAAYVVHHHEVVGVGQIRQLLQCRCSREADDTEVAGVHTHDDGGVGGERVGIVAGVGTVGGAHFHQSNAARAHDLRDAKSAPNLYRLAPRQDGFTTRCQRRED